jgi:hypothetical protein
MIDVATGWSERRAVLGRSYLVMKDAFLCILARLPFPVLEIHPDNGSEFFNHHMRAFWKDALGLFELSRSRPYQKNDNRFIEQKNSTLVRAYVGYERFDTVDQTLALNHIYNKMWPYYNFFQPVMRLSEKIYPGESGRLTPVQRRYDQARTPLDRLWATTAMSEEQQQRLRTLRQHINPRQLRHEIHDLLDGLFSLPCAVPGTPQNVYDTLAYSPFETEDLYCFLLGMPSVADLQKNPRKEKGIPGNIII